ncbi:MAG: OmpA family protein [Pseudomonadota bacterium]
MNARFRLSAALTASLLAGCATGPGRPSAPLQEVLKEAFGSADPCSNNSRNVAALVGAMGGLLIGDAIGNGKAGARVAGAGLGGMFGALVGADIDRRRCELAMVAKASNLEIQVVGISGNGMVQPTTDEKAVTAGLSVTVFGNEGQFPSGSFTPTSQAVRGFSSLAATYQVTAEKETNKAQLTGSRSRRMRLLLVGHTDDTGSSQFNADLSEQRARAIAAIFLQYGFVQDQIFYQGAGEVFPLAENSTEAGRARNRRVEIIDLSDEETFAKFLAERRPNFANYRFETSAGAYPGNPKLPARAPAQANASGAVSGPATNVTGVPNVTSTPRVASVPRSASGSLPQTTRPAGARQALPSAPKPSASAIDNLDLGGQPANGHYRSIDIGKSVQSPSASFISSANAAAEVGVGSCALDRARVSNRIKSLSTGAAIRTSAFLPGAAGASWSGKANGHLVGLTNVSVLREGTQPATRPTLFIWKDYVDGLASSPDLKTIGDVNAYQGDKAMLYRVFLNDGPVRCLDMVIPHASPGRAPLSNIVYLRSSAVYQADFSPTIARQ